MTKIKVHAGDFEDDVQNMILFNQMQLRPAYKAKVQQDIQDARSQGFWQSFKAGFQMPPKMESLGFTDIEDIEEASEESIKKLGGTIGWGLAGSVLLGPVGLLAGVLAGGNRKEVTFVARFKDQRKLLATVDKKTFLKIRASVFK